MHVTLSLAPNLGVVKLLAAHQVEVGAYVACSRTDDGTSSHYRMEDGGGAAATRSHLLMPHQIDALDIGAGTCVSVRDGAMLAKTFELSGAGQVANFTRLEFDSLSLRLHDHARFVNAQRDDNCAAIVARNVRVELAGNAIVSMLDVQRRAHIDMKGASRLSCNLSTNVCELSVRHDDVVGGAATTRLVFYNNLVPCRVACEVCGANCAHQFDSHHAANTSGPPPPARRTRLFLPRV